MAEQLRPEQNGRHFPDDFCKRIFVEENIILLSIPAGPIDRHYIRIGSGNEFSSNRRQAITRSIVILYTAGLDEFLTQVKLSLWMWLQVLWN